MSIHRISGYPVPGPATGHPAATPARLRPDARLDGVAVPATPAPVATDPGRTAIPAGPPPGTDPELWSVLTTEEREFFARLGAMGPLTYGRVSAGELPVMAHGMRGARLNVKA